MIPLVLNEKRERVGRGKEKSARKAKSDIVAVLLVLPCFASRPMRPAFKGCQRFRGQEHNGGEKLSDWPDCSSTN